MSLSKTHYNVKTANRNTKSMLAYFLIFKKTSFYSFDIANRDQFHRDSPVEKVFPSIKKDYKHSFPYHLKGHFSFLKNQRSKHASRVFREKKIVYSSSTKFNKSLRKRNYLILSSRNHCHFRVRPSFLAYEETSLYLTLKLMIMIGILLTKLIITFASILLLARMIILHLSLDQGK